MSAYALGREREAMNKQTASPRLYTAQEIHAFIASGEFSRYLQHIGYYRHNPVVDKLERARARRRESDSRYNARRRSLYAPCAEPGCESPCKQGSARCRRHAALAREARKRAARREN